MAYGDTPYDKELYTEWSNFCDKLKSAGQRVFKDSNPATVANRVDGFRYLTQNLGQAFDLALETKNTKYPRLHAFTSPTRKLGGDNADCIYIQAWIDGESVYKVSGNMGSARMWNITVQGPKSDSAYGIKTDRPLFDPFGDTPEANIFGDEIKANWDGTFELYIGGEKRGPNWLPTTKGTRKLFLRQYFDGLDEEAAEYRIERVGMTKPRPIPTPGELTDAMKWAADFTYNCVDYFPEFSWNQKGYADPDYPNILRHPDFAAEIQSDKLRGRVAAHMWWDLDEDEALYIEFADPRTFWMITAEGAFANSMDFLYRNVSFTPSRTAVDPDGKIRFIMTKNDPGYWNWIDSQGYQAGFMTFRNVQTLTLPEFTTKVVKASDAAKLMHPGSRKADDAARAEQLQKRFDAMLRRYRI